MIYRNNAEHHPLAAHRVESLGVFYTSINDGKEGVRAFVEKRPTRFTSSAADTTPGWAPWSSQL
jgi:hypothetical protein